MSRVFTKNLEKWTVFTLNSVAKMYRQHTLLWEITYDRSEIFETGEVRILKSCLFYGISK